MKFGAFCCFASESSGFRPKSPASEGAGVGHFGAAARRCHGSHFPPVAQQRERALSADMLSSDEPAQNAMRTGVHQTKTLRMGKAFSTALAKLAPLAT